MMAENTFPSESVPLLHVNGPVATICLNRPGKRNRLQDADLRTLLAHFNTVNADLQIRVLVLTAQAQQTCHEKAVFCAGYDIGGFDAASSQQPVVFEAVPDALERLRPLTICALNGSVYGGATDLALACDFRLGQQGMALHMPAAALGLHFYPSGLQRFVSRLGVAASKKLFLAAQPLPAQRLLELSYLDQLLPAVELETVTRKLASQLAALAPLAVQSMKQSLNELARAECCEPALARMREREALCHHSRDFAEGRRAFAEKRKPLFEAC